MIIEKNTLSVFLNTPLNLRISQAVQSVVYWMKWYINRMSLLHILLSSLSIRWVGGGGDYSHQRYNVFSEEEIINMTPTRALTADDLRDAKP